MNIKWEYSDLKYKNTMNSDSISAQTYLYTHMYKLITKKEGGLTF